MFILVRVRTRVRLPASPQNYFGNVESIIILILAISFVFLLFRVQRMQRDGNKQKRDLVDKIRSRNR